MPVPSKKPQTKGYRVLGMAMLVAILISLGEYVSDFDGQGATWLAGSRSTLPAPTATTTAVPAPSTAPTPITQVGQQPPSGNTGVPRAVAVDTAIVVGIVDGDTVDVSGLGQTVVRVRVLGVDAPELHGAVECGGRDASEFAARTLLGSFVELRSDPSQDRIDDYGRALRYVFKGGANYSEVIADEGFAESYIFGGVPVQLYPQILAAENRAKAAKRGMWGGALSCESAHQPVPPPAPIPAPQPEPLAQTEEPAPRPFASQPRSQPERVVEKPARKRTGSYSNCKEAREAGAGPFYRGEPGYAKHLDGDNDGIGCEWN